MPRIQDSGRLRFQEVVYEWWKRRRWLNIGKAVRAFSSGLFVYATPYKDRTTTGHVSIPPLVLEDVRLRGATHWIVRHDLRGGCWILPLDKVDGRNNTVRLGILKESDNQPEWFVDLAAFQEIPWQRWNYVEEVIRLQVINNLMPGEGIPEDWPDPFQDPIQPGLF
jgi:hypothetical protein